MDKEHNYQSKEFHPETLKAEKSIPDDVVDAVAQENREFEAATGQEAPPEQPLQVVTVPLRKPWFKRPRFWLGLCLFICVMGLLAWLIRPTRIMLANFFQQKATLTMTVLSESAPGQPALPLKNAHITVNGQKLATDQEGKATIRQSYGQVSIEVAKPGFTSDSRHFLLDIDPFFYKFGGKKEDESQRNPRFTLKATGLPLTFKAVDWVTGQPITSGIFMVGDISAEPNDEGIIKTTLSTVDVKKATLSTKFGGTYIDKSFEVAVQESPLQVVAFVPAGTQYMVKPNNGTYGVFASNIDGSAQRHITASETSPPLISVNSSGTRLAMIGAGSAGTQRLYSVDTNNGGTSEVASAQQFRIIDWYETTLVYVARNQGVQRLMAVNMAGGNPLELATAEVIGTVRMSAQHVVFMAEKANNNQSPQLFSVMVNGGSPVNLGNNIQTLTQPHSDTFAYRTAIGAWQEYNSATGRTQEVPAQDFQSRQFQNYRSQNGQYRLFAETTNGVRKLFAQAVAGGPPVLLSADSGLQGPVGWAGNTVIFQRIVNGKAAHYAVSVNGGTAKKISEVATRTAQEWGIN